MNKKNETPFMKQDSSAVIFTFFKSSRRFLLALLLFCLIPFLQSCSSSLAYNHLNRIAHWFLADYVELTTEQKQDFDRYFVQLHQWHRNNELDRYQASLKEIQQTLNNKQLSRKTLSLEVTKQSQQSYQYWLNLVQASSEPLGKLAKTLSTEQKKNFIDALNEKLNELDEKSARNDAPVKRRKRLTTAVERWFGELNQQQQKMIKQWSLEMPPTQALLKNYRKNWSNELKTAFYVPKEEIPSELSRVLIKHQRWQSETYKKTMAENRALTEQLIADLLDSRTQTQNRHINKQLKVWIRRLERWKS